MRKNYDFSQAKKGKKAKEVKVVKTFRIDPDVLQWLEEQGEKHGMGYQTYLNWFLRQSMQNRRSIEERVEELERVVYQKKGA